MGQPDAGDVHVSTAISNTRSKRKRRKSLTQHLTQFRRRRKGKSDET